MNHKQFLKSFIKNCHNAGSKLTFLRIISFNINGYGDIFSYLFETAGKI